MSTQLSEIGLIGLAVMGQNLALNIADHGFRISVFNRTYSKTEAFVSKNQDTPGGLYGYEQLKDFIASLKRPRRIIIMVQAGGPTDAVIATLTELLEEGDIIIDGGNAKWTDTIRREKELKEQGFLFVGSGVSGGETGARFGPSMMAGGDEEAWKHIQPIWESISAKVDAETGRELLGAEPGKPVEGGVGCGAIVGSDGAGHYVKMVHNGIEYGDMQMICEAYELLKGVLKMAPATMSDVFGKWNEGKLYSYLIEITTDILKQTDPETGVPFVDIVMDRAGQKGTGKWTSTSALDLGSPSATIAEAVFARFLSSLKEERVAAAEIIPEYEGQGWSGEEQEFIDAVHDALYCSKICSYAQGFQQMKEAQKEYDWELDFGKIAQIFRGGCIIRAGFLQKITEAYERDPKLANLLLDPFFNEEIQKSQKNWRKVIAVAVENGIAVPTFSSALAYYDSYRNARMPHNLLQAQRDYFGAHTYERTDKEVGKKFHLDWPDPVRPQYDA